MSTTVKEKNKICLSLKGVAVGLVFGFVVFLVLYLSLAIPAFETKREKVYGTVITVVSIVLSVISLGAQATDLGFTIKRIKDGE